MQEADVECQPDAAVIQLLTTTFQDMRQGQTAEGQHVDKPTAVMSTAEAVAVAFASCLEAHYFDVPLQGEVLLRHLKGTVLKDNEEDRGRLKQYFDVIVAARAERSSLWRQFYEARKHL